MGRKLGGGCAFWGELGPHLTKVAWAQAYLHTKWHLSQSSRLVHNRHGPKIGGSAPLGQGELGFHVNCITVEPNAETQN